jgi:hypothetical protein
MPTLPSGPCLYWASASADRISALQITRINAVSPYRIMTSRVNAPLYEAHPVQGIYRLKHFLSMIYSYIGLLMQRARNVPCIGHMFPIGGADFPSGPRAQ